MTPRSPANLPDSPAFDPTRQMPIEIIGDGVLLVSATGTVLDANQVSRSLLQEDDVLGRDLASLIDSAPLAAAVRAGRQVEVGLRLGAGGK
jgi:hypothetical protein